MRAYDCQYRNIQTSQVVRAARVGYHTASDLARVTGAPSPNKGDWMVAQPDGTAVTIPHSEFAAAYVPVYGGNDAA